MAEFTPFEREAANKDTHPSVMDESTHKDIVKKKPWHTPLDSVGPVATGPAPTMPHALDMIQQLAQPQYEGHGNVEGLKGGSGMPAEGENLMRRAVNFMNKDRR